MTVLDKKVREEEKVSGSGVHSSKRSPAPFWVDWSPESLRSNTVQIQIRFATPRPLPLHPAPTLLFRWSNLLKDLPHLSHGSWMACSLGAALGEIRSLTLHKLNINLEEANANNDVRSPVNILYVSVKLMTGERMILLRHWSLKLCFNGDAKPSDVLIQLKKKLQRNSAPRSSYWWFLPLFVTAKKRKKQKRIAFLRLIMMHKDEAACFNVRNLLTFLFETGRIMSAINKDKTQGGQ